MSDTRVGVAVALGAALLFGSSTPFVKALLTDTGANAGAALLYLGSGIGLAMLLALKKLRGQALSPLPRSARLRFAGAVVAGGVFAPALLVWGVRTTAASTSSLLLNLEGVLTALLAWVWFRENVNRRVFLGLLCIVAGGAVLSIQTGDGVSLSWGALAIAGACACWAIDNNLTQAASAADPMLLAMMKGLSAGVANAMLAFAMQQSWPSTAAVTAMTLMLGFAGYGLSLTLFIVALRRLGTARTGAYFGVAPFIGAAIAIVVFHEHANARLFGAGSLMAIGVWLHLTEHHAHEHIHEPLEHTHEHVHDEHHQHTHAQADAGAEPHLHAHQHEALTHGHSHTPDLHHRHGHKTV